MCEVKAALMFYCRRFTISFEKIYPAVPLKVILAINMNGWVLKNIVGLDRLLVTGRPFTTELFVF